MLKCLLNPQGTKQACPELKTKISLLLKFNISHQIRSLSFGVPLPNVQNPLDGTNITAETGKCLCLSCCLYLYSFIRSSSLVSYSFVHLSITLFEFTSLYIYLFYIVRLPYQPISIKTRSFFYHRLKINLFSYHFSGSEMYQYFVKIVPTVYKKLSGEVNSPVLYSPL